MRITKGDLEITKKVILEILAKQGKKLIIKRNQHRLFEAGASKKRLVNPKAKNPFVEKAKKKETLK